LSFYDFLVQDQDLYLQHGFHVLSFGCALLCYSTINFSVIAMTININQLGLTRFNAKMRIDCHFNLTGGSSVFLSIFIVIYFIESYDFVYFTQN